jgi:hypothetical protein
VLVTLLKSIFVFPFGTRGYQAVSFSVGAGHFSLLATSSSRFVASPLFSLWGSAKRWAHVIVQVHKMGLLACQELLVSSPFCSVPSFIVSCFNLTLLFNPYLGNLKLYIITTCAMLL